LRRAIIVILDNPSSHKIAGVCEATEAPPGLSAPTAPISTGSRRPSPGSKELLRKIAAALTVSALWDPRFTPEECANYLANTGYVSVKQNPL